MPYVSGEKGKLIEELRNKSLSEYRRGNEEEATCTLEAAWEEIPDEKTMYSESFLIVSYILTIAIKKHDIARLKKWGELILICDLERYDCGERECWMGKVEYELGNFESARKYFDIGVKKSKGGRCFGGNDGKFHSFYFDENK